MKENSRKNFHFWKELKRRNVLRSLAIYAGTAFIILEACSLIFPRWGLPDWSIDLVLWLLILGALINVILSWIYDITPQGMQRTKPLEEAAASERPSSSKGWKATTFISLVVIAALILFNIFSPIKTLKAGDIQSLVVLPFNNYTGDDQLEYFVSGMHSSLIGDIGKVGGLRVISKTSSDTYKDAGLSIPEIAEELAVDAVVEAQVMCLGDSICLQVRVMTPYPEEKLLWVADYKEEKDQILNLYNQVTRQIAAEVKVELTPDEEQMLHRKRTVNAEAYDAYLMGRYYWSDLGNEQLQKALEYLNSAVEKEPEWAAPYAGLAQVWVALAQMGWASPEIAGPEIMTNLQKAQELDPDFADSHFIGGIIAVWTEWNWEKGEKEFLQALAINPNDPMSRVYYGHLLMSLQRLDEAVSQGLRAVELDPKNPLILALSGVVMSSAGDREAASQLIEEALELDPTNFFAINVNETVGFQEKDIQKILSYLSLTGMPDSTSTKITKIEHNQGFDAALNEVVAYLEIRAHMGYVTPLDMAMHYYWAGEDEKVLEMIEMGLSVHDPNIPYINTGFVDFNRLYEHPRFKAVLDQANLPHPVALE